MKLGMLALPRMYAPIVTGVFRSSIWFPVACADRVAAVDTMHCSEIKPYQAKTHGVSREPFYAAPIP
jgi:hypothetical protein